MSIISSKLQIPLKILATVRVGKYKFHVISQFLSGSRLVTKGEVTGKSH